MGNPAFQIPIYDGDISFTDGAPGVGKPRLAAHLRTKPLTSPSPKPEQGDPKEPLEKVQNPEKEDRVEHKADDEPEDAGKAKGRHQNIRKGIGNKDGAEKDEHEGDDAPG